MKKLLIIIFLIIISYAGYYTYNNIYLPSLIPTIEPETSNKVTISKLYIYGTNLNLEGSITKINAKYTDLKLILFNPENGKQKEYEINLLKGFFSVMAAKDSRFILGPVLTRNTKGNEVEYLDEKKYKFIKEFGVEAIDNVIHISNGMDFYLAEELASVNNILLYQGNSGLKNPLNTNNAVGKESTFLLSDKKGLEGYNDCFDAYFARESIAKLKRDYN